MLFFGGSVVHSNPCAGGHADRLDDAREGAAAVGDDRVGHLGARACLARVRVDDLEQHGLVDADLARRRRQARRRRGRLRRHGRGGRRGRGSGGGGAGRPLLLLLAARRHEVELALDRGLGQRGGQNWYLKEMWI